MEERISYRLSKTIVLAGLTAYERHFPFLPVTWIESVQRRRIRSIVGHAYETVPFYQKKNSALLSNIERDPRYRAFLQKMKLPVD